MDLTVTRVYVPRFFVSSQQRFGATNMKALSASQLQGLGQIVLYLLGKSVLQLYFIQKIAEERENERESARMRERESVRKRFGSSFYMFFSLHLGLPYANWAQPGVLFVLPEVFTLVLGPSFDLPCLLATAILDFFSYRSSYGQLLK